MDSLIKQLATIEQKIDDIYDQIETSSNKETVLLNARLGEAREQRKDYLELLKLALKMEEYQDCHAKRSKQVSTEK